MPKNLNAFNHKWKKLETNLLPPPVGSRVVGFGYREPEPCGLESLIRGEIWKCTPTTTGGEVVEVFDLKRDKVKLRWPCFQTNARFDGSMSGGPIFNEHAQFCGLICSTYPPNEEWEEHASFVSSLWPSMADSIDAERDDLPKDALYPVLDLAKHGFIHAEGWENIEIVWNSDGNPKSVSIKKKSS